MPKITILGAGVTGMIIASQLPRDYDVTIVAEYHAGDDTKEWSSPWAGAIWVGVHDSGPREQKMQLDGFAGLWRLAQTNPESSARRIEMTEIMDKGRKEDVWYAGKVPNFRFLEPDELPKGALYGMKYQTVVLTPQKFLPWLQGRLEKKGVKFLRARVNALRDLSGMGHDVLINATGFGAEKLADVKEQNITSWRLQTVVVKNDSYDRLFIRRTPTTYSTAFARLDGTIYVGGVLKEGSRDLTISSEDRAQICRQAHENQPDVFPSPDPKDWPILYDHIGMYPTMKRESGGVRCARENTDDQKIIHAYGQNAGGYVYSFGLARAVTHLVEDVLFETPQSARL